MLGTVRQACQCTCKCVLQNSTRTLSVSSVKQYEHPATAVFERKHKVGLVGIGKYPYLKRRHYILNKLKHDGNYKTTMNCVLTKEVDGIGLKGTMVEVPKALFRHKLYPNGSAVYASPENLKFYENFRKESSEEGIDYETKRMMRKMAGFHLRVFMNPKNEWILEPVHLRVAFRKMGIVLGEDNIIMPVKSITEFGAFTFRLQMMERIACRLRGTVYPLNENGLPSTTVSYPKIWGNQVIDPENAVEFFVKREDLLNKDVEIDVAMELENNSSRENEGSETKKDSGEDDKV